MFPSSTPTGWSARRILSLHELEDRINPAPPLLQTITGITFNEDAANNGGSFHIPPDPYGAAGPAHVVSIVNTSIEFHTMAGAEQVSKSLKSFFNSLAPANDLFDPKVIYDQFENRFLVVALERVASPQSSRIMLAVSDDSDPNGTWFFKSINSLVNVGGTNTWADYPGFAVDEEAVYVTANMFPFSGGLTTTVRLWIAAKGTSGGWYAGGAATVSAALNPYASADFAVGSMPAHIYGTAPAGATGTFLVGYDGVTDGTNEYVQVTRIDNPLTSPSFNVQLFSVGDIEGNTAVDIPQAPQSGTTTTIDAGDRRVYNAVWRNNRLYFATTINPASGPDAGQATAHWFNVNTTNPASLTVADQGDVSGNDIAANAYTFYPNVAVDVDGAMAIGFAASAATIFPGAYYTGRKATDAAGTVQSTGALKAGEAFYIRTFGGDNRWGDYSGLSLAPDGRMFWVFNEYAMTQGTPGVGTGLGRWATIWGRFAFNTPPRVTTPIPDVTVSEDAGPTTIDLNPNFEDDEDADSALVYTVVGNTNPALVATSFPAANNLRLTYAADGNGTATITVRATDTGGAFVEDTFLVTVTAVNDAPTFTKGADQTVNEDAGAQTVANWATAISPGAANESGQTLTFEVASNSNPALFSALPAVSSSGTLTYTSAADANGSATITVRLKDNGGTANGGVDVSGDQTVTITVNPVNDVPSFTKGANQTVSEDAGAQTVTGWATAISKGPANESGQTLTFLVNTDNDTLFSTLPSVSPATGDLTYTPAANAFGTATVTVRLQDNGGTANGGVDTSAAQTFTITVNGVNDAPSFTKGADQTVNEDAAAQSVANWATNISAGPGEASQTVSFEVTSNSNPGLFSAGPAVAANGTLTYTPAANANGVADISVRIKDDGGTANGGADTSASQTFRITVTAVNDAPTFTKGADQTVNEDAGAQSVANWATALSAGPADESGQALTFEVASNTNTGLFAAGPDVDSSGKLTYTPAANANGTATIGLRLKDNGGTTNGGVDTSAAQTFTITVNSVNDVPSFTKGADQTVNEDAGAQTVANWATAISAGPANESGQTLTFLITTTNDALFSALPAVSATGTLTYTPAANANGAATVTVRLKDDGGTANGGIDTSPAQMFTITVNPVNDAPTFTKGADQTVNEGAGAQTVSGWATAISPGPADESGQAVTFEVTGNTNTELFAVAPAVSPTGTLTYTPGPEAFGAATITIRLKDDGGTSNGGQDASPTQTFTITVNAVNDAPSFTKGGNQTVNEDAGVQTVANWATNISAGPANESDQTLTFEVVSNTNPSLFSAGPAVNPATGALTYTPAADANGSATITLHLKDDGGTANGGVDVSGDQTFTITVNPVNDAPTFTKGPNQTVLEDAGAQTVANWAANISPGAANEAGQALSFEVVSNTNTGLFAAGPAVSPAGTLTYTPAANANGSATIEVRLKDDGGTANGGADVSGIQTFTITVTAVNDAPSFAKGSDQTVLEDAGGQTVTGWATGISAGPANESGQTLTFEVSTDNDGPFAVLPAINPGTGTLAYTPAANANGSATVTVRLKDSGGTANGGVDTSAPQTFTIAVTPVNDAPSFTKGSNQTVNEDAGPVTVAGWATGISPGAANETGQTLTFEVVSNTNTGLFAAGPAISPSGTLTYTSAPDAHGLATIQVRLKDDGGTTNGGADTSATQTFTITVNPVNDAPSFAKGANQSVLEDAGSQSVVGWATGMTAGPADEAGQTLTFNVTTDNDALFTALPAVNSTTGTLTYTLAANANGAATVTVRLRDNGGVANGGQDTSAPQTFTVTVNPVNDAPSFVKGSNQTVLEDAGPVTVAGWATAISPGAANEAGQALTFEVTGNTNPSLFAAGPAVSPGGTLTFTPAPDANGSATIQVRLRDDGGTANGGADTSAAQTFTITVNSVNDAPTFSKGGDQAVLEDAGAHTVTGWATGMSAGPADESGQTLTFQVTTNNDALFTVLPAVNPTTGTLTYTPAANANGAATVTVRLTDNSGTANGGVDTSAAQTFTITVRPVNDAPSFTKGPDVTVEEDAGPQSESAWATGLSRGPVNESAQALTFEVVSNSNPDLFAVAPAVSPTGALTFTAAADTNGSATITIRLRDDGGTADGGVDFSGPETFTITVNPQNDTPVAVADEAPTTDQQAITVDVLANDTDADGDPLTLVSVTGATKGTATVVGNQVRYVPRVNAHGDDLLTYTVRDPAGATATGTLTVHVTDVTIPTVQQVRLYYGNGRYELLTERVPVFGWSNVRRVQLVFSENVSVQQNDLSLTGVNLANYAFSAFNYNASAFTATWTLGTPIGIDRLRLALDGTTASGVKDVTAGNLIGSDVVRLFAVLPGDLDGDGLVTLDEANTVRRNIGKRYPNPRTADVNGDGAVTKADYLIAKGNIAKHI